MLEAFWRRGRPGGEPLSIDRDSLSEAEVIVEFGAGTLRVGAGAAAGKLLEGEFSDGAEYQLRPGQVRLYGSRDWNWWGWWGGGGRQLGRAAHARHSAPPAVPVGRVPIHS